MNVTKFALAGGLFAAFTFVHFVIDWVFQSHSEAMVKHNTPGVRAKHCLIYTSPFLPLLWWLGCRPYEIAVSALVLFISHFIEDTYAPVYWWAKHIRKVPGMRHHVVVENPGGKVVLMKAEPKPDGTLMVVRHEFTAHGSTIGPNNERVWPSGSIEAILQLVEDGDWTPEHADEMLEQRGFREFIDGALGKILMISIDQIIHLAFLWVPIWFVLRHQ